MSGNLHAQTIESAGLAGGGAFVEELNRAAGADEVILHHGALAAGEIGAALEGVAAAGDGREFEHDIGADGANTGNAQGASGIQRIGAGDGFLRVEDAVASGSRVNAKGAKAAATTLSLR